MKAAILRAVGEPLEVRDDVKVCDLGPSDVHIKLVSSGVCHSDLSVQNGTIPSGTPCVLGHEGAGIVLECGDQVRRVKAGDHVIVSFTPACGVCVPCLRGQSNLCGFMFEMMKPTHFELGGQKIAGMTGCGTFAEEMIVSEHAVVKVDDTAPGIAEGLAAGSWTVGVAVSGNALGLDRDELRALPDTERQRRVQGARDALMAAGAHCVIDSVADLVPVIDAIDARLALGGRPAAFGAPQAA